MQEWDQDMYRDIQTALDWRAPDGRNVGPYVPRPGAMQVGVARAVLAKQVWLEGFALGIRALGYQCDLHGLDGTAPYAVVTRGQQLQPDQ